jgi:hypothetical protein
LKIIVAFTGICENDYGLKWHIYTNRLDIFVVKIKMDISEDIYDSIIRKSMNPTPFSLLMVIISITDLKTKTDSISETLGFN